MTEPGPARAIGGYQLRESLGTGAFGAVYRAWDPRAQRDVAVKILLKLDPKAVARFDQEARAIARLDHRGIVPLLDQGVERGRPYLVMPYVEGETLQKLVDRDHPIPLQRALGLVRDVACAIQFAHDRGVLHRDLKPANVLVEPGDGVRVVDFGLARLNDGARLTKTGVTLGTPFFVSPEQASGKGLVDARSDVYALGAILYYTLTGRVPLEADTEVELWSALFQRVPDPPSTHRPGLPARVDAICARALAKAPGERHPTAGDLADALDEAALAGDDPPPRSRRTPVLLGALGLLVVGAVALGIAARQSEPDPTPVASSTPTAPAPTPTPSAPPNSPSPAPSPTATASPKASTAKLTVELNVPGFVSLEHPDGLHPPVVGSAPLTADIAPGNWKVTADADGYTPSRTFVKLEPGQVFRLPGRLTPRERWVVELSPKAGVLAGLGFGEFHGHPAVMLTTATHLAVIGGAGDVRWMRTAKHGFGAVSGTLQHRRGPIVYASTKAGGLAAFSRTGRPLWTDDTPGARYVVGFRNRIGGFLVVSYPEANLVRCIDGDGKEVWRHTIDRPGRPNTASVNNVNALLIPGRSALHCLGGTGRVRWRVPLPTGEPGDDPAIGISGARTEILVTRPDRTFRLTGDPPTIQERFEGRIVARLNRRWIGSSRDRVLGLPDWSQRIAGLRRLKVFSMRRGQTPVLLALGKKRMIALSKAGKVLWSEPSRGAEDVVAVDVDRDEFPELLLTSRTPKGGARLACWSAFATKRPFDFARRRGGRTGPRPRMGYDERLDVCGRWLVVTGPEPVALDLTRKETNSIKNRAIVPHQPGWDMKTQRIVFAYQDDDAVVAWRPTRDPVVVTRPADPTAAVMRGDLAVVASRRGFVQATVRGELLTSWRIPGYAEVSPLLLGTRGGDRISGALLFGTGGVGQRVELRPKGRVMAFPLPGPVRFQPIPLPGQAARFEALVATQTGKLVRYRFLPTRVDTVRSLQLDWAPGAQPAVLQRQGAESLFIVPCRRGWLYAVKASLKGIAWAARPGDGIPLGGVSLVDVAGDRRPEIAQAWYLRKMKLVERSTRTVLRVYDPTTGRLLVSLPAGEDAAASPPYDRRELAAVGGRVRIWNRWNRLAPLPASHADMRALLVAGAYEAAVDAGRGSSELSVLSLAALAASRLGNPAPLQELLRRNQGGTRSWLRSLAGWAYRTARKDGVVRALGKESGKRIPKPKRTYRELETELRAGAPVGFDMTAKPPIRRSLDVFVSDGNGAKVAGKPALLVRPGGRIRLGLPAGLGLNLTLLLRHRVIAHQGIRGDATLTVRVDGKVLHRGVHVPWRRFERDALALGTFGPGNHQIEIEVDRTAPCTYAIQSAELVPFARPRKR